MLRVGLAAILAVAADPTSAKVLIVRSAGPMAKSYPVGRSLPENAQIKLGAGDTLTLLGGAGTLTLRGPGTFAATVLVRPDQRARADNRRAVIAAVRGGPVTRQGTPNVPRAFNVWQIDVTQSGSFCLLRSTDVILWRPDAKAPATVTISPARGAPQVAEWPAGQNSVLWAPISPFLNGGAYTFRQAVGSMPKEITVHVVKLSSSVPQDVAAVLIKNGCERQLNALVDGADDQTPLIAPMDLKTDKMPQR